MDRSQANNTLVFGTLKDPIKTKEIQQFLLNQGVQTEIILAPDDEEYKLQCLNQEQFDYCRQVFLEQMGLAPKEIEIDPAYLQIKNIQMTKVNLAILLMSAGVFLIGLVIDREKVFPHLYISKDIENIFAEVMQGEVYRLVTPIFLHFNFMHILFNSLWMKDLGKIIENAIGSKKFILMIVALGVTSNLLQYLFRGPYFGGLSGVVYGLLGYLWMSKKFNNNQELVFLPKRDIYLMIGWYIVCLTGLFGPIANLAHGMGLTLGMLMGILSSQLFNLNFEKIKWIVSSLLLLIISAIVEYFKMKGNLYVFHFIN